MTKFQLDEKLVRRLSELLDETGLTEIEYEAGGQRIRVARGGIATALAAPAQTGAATSSGRPIEAQIEAEAAAVNAVTAPMVGTVYVAPEPDAPSFVAVGDQVETGQTLLIIEAMKVMNPIQSPRAGQITAIYVHDGQPVEFGEPLLVIE